MQFFTAAKTDDVAINTMKAVTAGGKAILLANVAGNFYAILQKCPHMGADLCQGSLAGAVVTCPKHGAAFDVTSGQTMAPAKILFLKMNPKNAVTFPVKIEDGQILIGV